MKSRSPSFLHHLSAKTSLFTIKPYHFTRKTNNELEKPNLKIIKFFAESESPQHDSWFISYCYFFRTTSSTRGGCMFADILSYIQMDGFICTILSTANQYLLLISVEHSLLQVSGFFLTPLSLLSIASGWRSRIVKAVIEMYSFTLAQKLK